MDLKGYVRIFFPLEGEWEVETVYLRLIRAGDHLIWDVVDYNASGHYVKNRFIDHTIHLGDFHSPHWDDNWGACLTHNWWGWHLPFEEHHLSGWRHNSEY